MAVAVPQPQLPQPEPQAGAPKWALGAGLLAVAAAAFKLAWSFRRPLPVAPPPAPTEEKVALPSAAADAPRGAVKEAAEPAVSVNGAGAPADVASVGPVLLAAEAAGVVDETPTMSLEELRSTATELYMLIQQMELHLQEMSAELADRLPEASLAQLDELAAQLEGVEEKLAGLKGREAGDAEVDAAEQQYAELQWQQFTLLTERAADTDRRSYRSLLFNLRTQRQLLRQVEAQEALRLRMAQTEARIAALFDAEQRQLDGRPAQPAKQAQQPQQAQQAQQPQQVHAPVREHQQQQQEQAEHRQAVQEQAAELPPHIVGSSFSVDPAAAAEFQAEQKAGPAAAPEAPAAAGQLRLAAAGASIPHPAKAAAGGEDAFFVSTTGRCAFGVADGVGGWAAEGVDPALYPRRLMAACQEAIGGAGSAAAPAMAGGGDDAAGALLKAAHGVTEEPGSTTVILGVLLPGGRLSVANLGDCQLKVVRRGRVAFSTQVLEHQWNMPLQLSCPSFYDCGSRPEDADSQVVQLQAGDVVVAGSDGLWDNLWEWQMLEAVGQEQQEAACEVLAERLALRLAREAFKGACDPDFVSPFSVERQQRVAAAAAAAGMVLPAAGGKKDDVTAVVAVVAAEAP
ncbi:hypothetical protein ABPG77_010021 [Micractinium sp. CCAP 211/92]